MEKEQLTVTQISERFLLGDLVKMVINELKQLQLGWGMTPERQQELIIERVTNNVRNAVIDVTKIIAANGRPHLEAEVEQVVFKDGIKAVLQISKTMAERHVLSDAVGSMVLIVIPEIDKHLGGDAPKADKNQLDITGL